MTKSGMNPKVDFYFSKAKKWQKELEKLRMITLDCELTEELKWACKTSFKNGLQGFVSFFSKTKLIDHYVKAITTRDLKFKELLSGKSQDSYPFIITLMFLIRNKQRVL